MTKKERVLAAMNNQPVDRPPVGFWFHFPPQKTAGQACIDAHLEYYNHVDVDIAKLMCDGYFDYPHPVAKAVKEAADWYRLTPLGADSPYIREQVARAKGVREGLTSDCLVLYNVFAPFSVIRFGTSNELVMRHLREDPAAIEYALNVIAEDQKTLCEKLITEAGIDGVYYCVQGGEKDRFTAEEYRRLITPSDKAVLEYANRFTAANVLHCCGWAGIPNHLEVWKDYPAQAVNWACFVENVDLTAGKRFFGGKCVLGGFDNRAGSLINTGTKEDIQAYTRKLIWKHGGLGVMIGADCTLPATIDTQRIQWVVDAAKECARA